MQFKACGIRRANSINESLITRTDFFGINFSPLSKRRPSIDELPKILELIPREKQVFVFKDNSAEEIREAVNNYQPKYIQLYEENIAEELVGIAEIILAFNVKSESDIEQVKQNKTASILLIEGAKSGVGESIDSSINLDLIGKPFFLAGGITTENVAEKTAHYKNCIGFDLASGIEIDRHVSTEKIEQFIHIRDEISTRG